MPRFAPSPEAGATAVTGDARSLTNRLGSPAVVNASTGSSLTADGRPMNLASLRAFVVDYRDRVLAGSEVDAIRRAYEYARLGHARELIALDTEWASSATERPFRQASMAVGRRQLASLRPLRDQRVIQRYAAAVDAGDAKGWHVIVYGIALAVFGIPLQTGLLHYAQQTLGGFMDATPTSHLLTDRQKAELHREIDASLPAILNQALPIRPALRLV